jgi:DeoR/GlpR family transcriptional regulator of sugar metabolism
MSAASIDRREKILRELRETGHVSARQMAEALAVSEDTIRRDLKVLAETNPIELVYGGASLPRSRDFSFRSKAARFVEEKKVIGQLAAEFVSDGDMILLDSGTTTFAMTAYLRRKRDLTILVNSAHLALELDMDGFNVLMLGGQYRRDRMDTIGTVAVNTLSQFRGYTAFVGSDGLSREFGLTASDIESASLYRVAVENARRTVLMVDNSKFDNPSLFKIADFDKITRVVTDRKPSAEWMEFFAARGIAVTFPDAAQGPQ